MGNKHCEQINWFSLKNNAIFLGHAGPQAHACKGRWWLKRGLPRGGVAQLGRKSCRCPRARWGRVWLQAPIQGVGYCCASATTTRNVIDVDAISEPATNADNLSILSDEEDSDPDVPSNGVSGSSLVKDANINADAHSNGYVPLCWKYVNPDGVASKAIVFLKHLTYAENFAQSSVHLASSEDDQKALERAAAEVSYTTIGCVLEDARIALHSIQHAGPTNLHAGYGASQRLMPCSHPTQRISL